MITFIIILAIFLLIYKLTPNPADKQAVGKMVQMLESFYIIDNTVKFDVFTRRLGFIGQLANGIPKNANQKKCAEVALQTYARKYPNVSTSPTLRLILDQPQIANSAKFRDEAATAFYLRTCSQLKIEIATLKTRAAKLRRVEQSHMLANYIIDGLASVDRQKYIDCIHNECTVVSEIASL